MTSKTRTAQRRRVVRPGKCTERQELMLLRSKARECTTSAEALTVHLLDAQAGTNEWSWNMLSAITNARKISNALKGHFEAFPDGEEARR